MYSAMAFFSVVLTFQRVNHNPIQLQQQILTYSAENGVNK